MKQINGNEALARMRQLKTNEQATFQMSHLTYNATKDQANGMRHVDRARLRFSLPDDAFDSVTADLFLPYTDLSMRKGKQNRMCRKKLIRFVAFPPNYELLKVNWFANE